MTQTINSAGDELLEEILGQARGDDEQLRALRIAFEKKVGLPTDAFVIGQPLSVLGVDYDGHHRRGLTARCRCEDGGEHLVSLADVRFARAGEASRYLGAYRAWLGLAPSVVEPANKGRTRQHKVEDDDIDLSRPVDLIVLRVKERTARCRLFGSERTITLRASDLWVAMPGHVVTIKPRKQWRYGGHPYLSGVIEEMRIDVPALELVPLRLEDRGEWDPRTHYWGEEDGPLEAWAEPIFAAGSRPMSEMEQVLPGADPLSLESGPILESIRLAEAEDFEGAREILAEMLETDLRCLDAHVHLGNLSFDHLPSQAIGHYEIGMRIGELSLGGDFGGVLPWGCLDNRPFLRSMKSYALCLWRLDRHGEAAKIFERLLWLNPTDNQGCRFLLPEVRAGDSWSP